MFRKSILFCSALLCCVCAAGAKRAMTIEDFYRVHPLKEVSFSPDGKSLVFTVTTRDLPKATSADHIWMMNADGANSRQLTFSAKGESAPVFSPDGKWIAFVSSRDGDSELYLLPPNGGEAKKLTDISTGVSDPVWSPDGKWIAFSTDVYPECGADDACNKRIADRWSKGKLKAHMAESLLYRHWTEWKDGKRTHIFLADAGTGAVRDLTPGDFDSPAFQLEGPLQYDFSPDSSELAFVSKRDNQPASSTNNDIWLVSVSGSGQARNITASNPAFDGNPRYSPDGRYIAYRMQKQPGYESDLFRLAVYDRREGTSRVLTESFQNWIDDFRWAADSRSLYFAAEVEGAVPVYQLTLDGAAPKRVLLDKAIGEFVVSRDNSKMAYIRSAASEPSEIFAVALTGSASTARLSHFNDAIADEVAFSPAERMPVEGSDGAKVDVFIVKPFGFTEGKKYPLILNVHGGPQSQWMDSFRGDWQVYPGAGYVVAYANPHGSTGYGQAFTAEISGDWGGRVFDDLVKVSDALAKLPYVDAARMGAMGWSFGGYMMDWFEGHTTRFKALASMMGIYDLRSFYGATEELWFPEWDLKGQPWNSLLFEKLSPSNFVENFKTPCLIISGERDYRVPYTQSLQFFTALRKKGVPSKLIIYPDAGHWPSWYEMALYYTAHLEWFQKYLGGGGAPWSSQQFMRNSVFDPATGQRYKDGK
jgi:dipeptidyl aminopeptidase/acylaminoacyl peptidase